MATKADFNAEAWSKVAEGPLLAGLRVISASRGGTVRESVAMAKTYRQAREAHGQNGLLDELVAAPPSLDANRIGPADEIPRVTAEGLREAVAILQQEAAPGDVEAYRSFVMAVAEAAAGAHKEGGFLGVGGKKVSVEEQAALDEIAAALGDEPGG